MEWEGQLSDILYLTMNGILDHLGYSQVLRVVEGLAQRGLSYRVASMERRSDLARESRVTAVRRRLEAVGVEWTFATYQEGSGAWDAAANLRELWRLGAASVRAQGVELVHARGYHGGLVAALMQATSGIRYLFDPRGYFIDERLEEGRWFSSPTKLGAARWVERSIYRNAARIVALTELHAIDIEAAGLAAQRACVIPTCADFDQFKPLPRSDLHDVPPLVVEALTGRLVLGIVGSWNRAYVGSATAALAARVLSRRPDARVLVLSAQPEPWKNALLQAGVPTPAVVFASAAHEAMPEWMTLISWGLLLLAPDSRAKRAMMPTKLAEFFGSGVQPVVHGCNSEVREWVQRSGGGLVLPGLGEDALDAAAARIGSGAAFDPEKSRLLTAAHFSLSSGLERYEAALRSLLVTRRARSG